MKMYSMQRRNERYRILYTWKVLEGLVPNCGVEAVPDSEEDRRGRRCVIPSINTGARAAVRTIREQSFQVHGPQLYNSLPKEIRNITGSSVGDFKAKLDDFLSLVPDEPKIGGLFPGACTALAQSSNSIRDQTRRVPGGSQTVTETVTGRSGEGRERHWA